MTSRVRSEERMLESRICWSAAMGASSRAGSMAAIFFSNSLRRAICLWMLAGE
jgi:hypothetical protein